MSHIEQIPPYLTWKIRQRALYPGAPVEKVILEQDDDGMHLGLFDENQLRAVVSLFREGSEVQFRKLGTLPEFQGRGYGTALIVYLLKLARREEVTRVWCNARRTASGFYKKFGFIETTTTYNKSGIDYFIMEKSIPDRKYD